jgi:putative transposase
LHKLTTMLAKSFGVIGIENLNIAGMVANRKLARAISDMGFFEFRRQLEYKAEMHGAKVVVVDRFFPSSKRCSDCGIHAGEMRLDVRQWTCDNCGETHGRDVNAALNLSNMAAIANPRDEPGTVADYRRANVPPPIAGGAGP